MTWERESMKPKNLEMKNAEIKNQHKSTEYHHSEGTKPKKHSSGESLSALPSS